MYIGVKSEMALWLVRFFSLTFLSLHPGVQVPAKFMLGRTLRQISFLTKVK